MAKRQDAEARRRVRERRQRLEEERRKQRDAVDKLVVQLFVLDERYEEAQRSLVTIDEQREQVLGRLADLEEDADALAELTGRDASAFRGGKRSRGRRSGTSDAPTEPPAEPVPPTNAAATS